MACGQRPPLRTRSCWGGCVGGCAWGDTTWVYHAYRVRARRDYPRRKPAPRQSAIDDAYADRGACPVCYPFSGGWYRNPIRRGTGKIVFVYIVVCHCAPSKSVIKRVRTHLRVISFRVLCTHTHTPRRNHDLLIYYIILMYVRYRM